MKYTRFAIFICILAFNFCSPIIKKPPLRAYNRLPNIDFCDLPHYQNRLVCLKFTYSGVDEYWSMHPLLEVKSCVNELKVELDFEDKELSPEVERAFANVHKSYWNSYLIIEAIGVYETGKRVSYGHLGSNNARFLVKKFIKTRLKKTL